MDFKNYSEEIQELVAVALKLATDYKSRYFLPEHLLYAMAGDREFVKLFELHGGDTDKLREDIVTFLTGDMTEKTKKEGRIQLSEDFTEVFRRADIQAKMSGREETKPSHIFSAILSLEDSYAVYFIMNQPVDLVELLGDMSRQSIAREHEDELEENGAAGFFPANGWNIYPDEEEGVEFSTGGNRNQSWKEYVECISKTAQEKNPLIGREEELERTIQILCRMEKNNVLHVGEPGVGKTALIYGIAQKITEGSVPESLKDTQIYSMDMGTMVAGTQYRGEFEQRFQMIMRGLSQEDHPILYLDEIHNIVGAGATGEGSLDLSNMLKPYLAEGRIRFVGATTYEEYRKYFAKNKSLLRRFQKVDIKEPSEEETIHILEGLKPRYEKYHDVKYAKGVFLYAVEMSRKYINERFLPDKAIDLIDEAGAYRKIHPTDRKTQTVNKDLIDDMIALTCNVPKQRLEQDDIKQLAVLEQHLKEQIFGQSEAVVQVSNAIKFSRAGLNEEEKPVASFLFVGPTGVGKTETARALAAELGIAFLRFDMSEYTEKHAVAKLIGAPAGYVGYEDGGLLTEEVRKHPYAVLLLDEIEKAHPDIFNILLQVMDYATLTDNQGRKADFRNIILIMTSNAGASSVGKNGIGFGSTDTDNSAIHEAVKSTFQPEFRNRLSRIVVFSGMDDAMAARITGKKLRQLKDLMQKKQVELSVTEAAAQWIQKKGITKQYGAREIDRVIAGEVKPLLVEELLFGKLKKGGKCTIDVNEEKLICRIPKNR
jgi:ATP-dependent Clp protease ATP-binding subunit ClpA